MPTVFSRYLAGLCLLFSPVCIAFSQPGEASAEQLGSDIRSIFEEEAFANAWWGAAVVNLNDGSTLFSHYADRSFVPASNTKLFTTAAALDILGPHYRYKTELYIEGEVVNGILEGNVIVRGSGDPVIGGRFTDGDRTAVFRHWADSLRAAGVYQVSGDIIGDDDIFDDKPLGYGWSWDDETYWYSAEVSGLSFNDNIIDFSITATGLGEPADVSWEPHNTSYATVLNQTISISQDSSLVEGYFRARGSNTIELASEVPQGRSDLESLTVTNPTAYFVHVLQETLKSEGIQVMGLPKDVDALSIKPKYNSDKYQRVAVHVSKPMRDIVSVINKKSQNLYAEQVLRTLATEYPKDDPEFTPGSAALGLDIAMKTFVEAGIDTSRLQLVDGSGLSRMNLIAPDMTLSLLTHMWNHPDESVKRAFYDSLPIGGIDGTLEYRFRSGAATGIVRAKTGTLSNVSSLAGYVTTKSGMPLAFVLMCNNHTQKSKVVRAAQDRIVNLLVDHEL